MGSWRISAMVSEKLKKKKKIISIYLSLYISLKINLSHAICNQEWRYIFLMLFVCFFFYIFAVTP